MPITRSHWQYVFTVSCDLEDCSKGPEVSETFRENCKQDCFDQARKTGWRFMNAQVLCETCYSKKPRKRKGAAQCK